jgi:hypothetical protein
MGNPSAHISSTRVKFGGRCKWRLVHGIIFVKHKLVRPSANASALALAILATAGCGRGSVKTYPVTVKLSYPDGKTAEGAIVAFYSVPDTAENNGGKPVSAVGKIGADGTCQLSTFIADDGAVAGRHRITVAPPVPPPIDIGKPQPKTVPIPSRYRKPSTSGLEAKISSDGPNVISIEIKPR